MKPTPSYHGTIIIVDLYVHIMIHRISQIWHQNRELRNTEPWADQEHVEEHSLLPPSEICLDRKGVSIVKSSPWSILIHYVKRQVMPNFTGRSFDACFDSSAFIALDLAE